jgi:hypothetical protein
VDWRASWIEGRRSDTAGMRMLDVCMPGMNSDTGGFVVSESSPAPTINTVTHFINRKVEMTHDYE